MTVKYKSVKHAIGHYHAASRGPDLAQVRLVKVQESRMENSAWLAVSSAIHSPDGLDLKAGDPRLEQMVEWATTADGVYDGGPLVGKLAALLREREILEETPEVPAATQVEFVDIYSGENIRLTKLK